MRGRVILLLLSSLLSVTAALPQCNYRLEYSANVRSSYFDAVLDGDDLWTATGYGVQIFDRRLDPPRLVAAAAVPATTRSLDVRSGVAYAASGTAVHVLRRLADRVEVVRSLDVGATVNDVLATSSTLFVATTNGLLHFDRRDPLNPPSPTPLATSSANVLSLARNGDNEVLAADGDGTVERFNASTGSPLGSLAALSRSLSVSVAGSRIFVSDGQQTQIFTSTGIGVATPAVGGMTVAAHGDNTLFMAGSDRRFRAVDLAAAGQPVELFAADILPTGGTVNRIGALVASGNRLYVAAGDAGLLTFDTTGFAPPFPLRGHTFDAKTSLVDAGSAIFASDTKGGLSELTRFSSGSLGQGRSWAASQAHLVHDFANDFLLTSSGAALSYWSTGATTPALISTATLSGAIRTAALNGSTAIALLEDGSIWSVEVSRQNSIPARIDIAGATFLARSDRGVAVAVVSPAGTTDIRFYPNADFAAAPIAAAVPGATPVLAMSDSRVAVFTFRGITIVDFSTGARSEYVLPESNSALVRDIEIQGSKLIDVTESALRVWDLDARRMIQSFAILSPPLSVSTHPTAAIATVLTSGSVVTVSYEATSRQPVETAVTGGNEYPRKIVATPDRLFVFEGQSIDVYHTGHSPAPAHATSIPVAGALDLAVSDAALFVLFSNGVVTSYAHTGAALRSARVDEGSDTVPIGIFVAGGAPWVSVSRGCLTTGCEQRTVVLDPASLVRTAAIDGGMDDVTVSGTVAHAIVDIPPATEIRSYSIIDPLHPSVVASRSSEGSPAAIATSGGTVYVLGTRLFAYSTPALTKAGEELSSAAVTAASDLAIEETCAVITGRSSAAEMYGRSGSQWALAGFLSIPGVARGVTRQPGRMIILTDYSIEIWSRLPPPVPARRRGV